MYINPSFIIRLCHKTFVLFVVFSISVFAQSALAASSVSSLSSSSNSSLKSSSSNSSSTPSSSLSINAAMNLLVDSSNRSATLEVDRLGAAVYIYPVLASSLNGLEMTIYAF